jgi:ribose 5-phosphate isomerase B
MQIALGADHAGFELKERLKATFADLAVPFEDFGVATPDRADYPDIAAAVARAVVAGQFRYGVLVCGTGTGMAIAANKIHGIRAAAANTPALARLARGHNDANILAMGGRILSHPEAAEIVRAFLDTPFDGGRHQLRIDKITRLES